MLIYLIHYCSLRISNLTAEFIISHCPRHPADRLRRAAGIQYIPSRSVPLEIRKCILLMQNIRTADREQRLLTHLQRTGKSEITDSVSFYSVADSILVGCPIASSNHRMDPVGTTCLWLPVSIVPCSQNRPFFRLQIINLIQIGEVRIVGIHILHDIVSSA